MAANLVILSTVPPDRKFSENRQRLLLRFAKLFVREGEHRYKAEGKYHICVIYYLARTWEVCEVSGRKFRVDVSHLDRPASSFRVDFFVAETEFEPEKMPVAFLPGSVRTLPEIPAWRRYRRTHR